MTVSRFENSPDLFGSGVGASTCGDIQCGLCGVIYNENEPEDNPDGESIRYTEFAGLTICECCFGLVENEIYRRMSAVLPWYEKILVNQRNKVNGQFAALDSVLEEVEKKSGKGKRET